MRYVDYYNQFQATAALVGADEMVSDDDDPSARYEGLTDQELIDLAVAGAGVKGVGDEIARRGLLDQVPGDNWGE